jgi:hypothetical protein
MLNFFTKRNNDVNNNLELVNDKKRYDKFIKCTINSCADTLFYNYKTELYAITNFEPKKNIFKEKTIKNYLKIIEDIFSNFNGKIYNIGYGKYNDNNNITQYKKIINIINYKNIFINYLKTPISDNILQKCIKKNNNNDYTKNINSTIINSCNNIYYEDKSEFMYYLLMFIYTYEDKQNRIKYNDILIDLLNKNNERRYYMYKNYKNDHKNIIKDYKNKQKEKTETIPEEEETIPEDYNNAGKRKTKKSRKPKKKTQRKIKMK